MADPLYELLQPYLQSSSQQSSSPSSSSSYSPEISQYLSRLVSLRLSDLTTTEPQSLAQAQHSNLVSLQALSSRSYRTTTISSDHLSTLQTSLPQISAAVESIRKSIPVLDASAVTFASSYGRSKDEITGESQGTALLAARRNASLLARQADKAQDILELPSLLRASIASAGTAASASTSTSSTSSANYTQALDLFAHIKRLQILYPDSQLLRAVLVDAEIAMKDMTTNLIASLRGPNLRLAPAIRMIGWLRRVAPELSTAGTGTGTGTGTGPTGATANTLHTPTTLMSSQMGSLSTTTPAQDEGHFGALFLVARLCTFLSMTEALAPLRDLADQETQARKEGNAQKIGNRNPEASTRPHPSRKPSGGGGYNPQVAGQQTERYLKRYIEIFREQSFATISMYRNIFPVEGTAPPSSDTPSSSSSSSPSPPSLELDLALPPALQTFPLHLVEIFMATLKQYLPNVTDATARESLLMQVLYAANSLGRLGADFSLLIAELYEEDEDESHEDVPSPLSVQEGDIAEATTEEGAADNSNGAVGRGELSHEGQGERGPRPKPEHEPEWITVIKKHRVQAARLEALAAGQERVAHRQGSVDVAVR
ncbi:hypothetical protein G647_02510 [Cladophialophora carrionii CBS 160.54]|uniref:Conserved oligomeric Golgi complex subunit 8 n=1 Tax=Cladophialophora carrionii CBS 160.54 TaxID=1279043 RepID=V9DGB6_9EURO|nr:uncharacterized protein G647_02510 [Cladophialophora carrionii CBS 160.54]ETI25736.1 hypothetical protein G647_02510 [Cladophialophora carrionii CBS 160.54]